MLFDEYCKAQDDLSQKYGDCVVLYGVGSFYEIYSLSEEFIRRIGALLNIVVTRKNKGNPVIDASNHYLCGFPVASLHRFVMVLLHNNVTVAVYDQKKTGTEVSRNLTRVYSPATVIDETQPSETNVLMTIAFQHENDLRTGEKTMMLGAAAVDLSTGASWVYQTVALCDRVGAVQDALRLIKTFQPREVVLFSDGRQDLEEALELGGRLVHRHNSISNDIKDVVRQNHILANCFPVNDLLSPLEQIDLENKPFAAACLVQTLLFVEDHDEAILKRLRLPHVMNDMKHLLLENNAVQQLNILPAFTPGINNPSGRLTSVFDAIDYCSTAFGRRCLKTRLVMPSIDIGVINRRQSFIAKLLETEQSEQMPRYKGLQEELSRIADIERLHRRLTLGRLSPCDLSMLATSCLQSAAMMSSSRMRTVSLPYPAGQQAIDLAIFAGEVSALGARVQDLFDTNELERCKTTVATHLVPLQPDGICSMTHAGILLRGRSTAADKLANEMIDDMGHLIAIQAALTQSSPMEGQIRLEYSERDGYHLLTTKRRAEALKRSFVAKDTVIVRQERGELRTSEIEFCQASSTSNTRLTGKLIRELSERIHFEREMLAEECRKEFLQFTEQLIEQTGLLQQLVEVLVEIDVAASGARCADLHGYTRPVFAELRAGDRSFVDVRGLRHPIIERLQKGVAYVANDVILGSPDEKEDGRTLTNGMLLYGVNSSGKSSLMKALGIAVVMAQAGLYVPATEMRLAPFHRVMTRILGQDNLWKSMSSFACEMQELRSILRCADAQTLVLGDELASSTETTSGIAIVAASIMRLSKSGAKFLLSSHLHELADIGPVVALSNVRCFHLECHYDSKLDALVYDRVLVPGSGNAHYGLEVCAASGFDAEFIRTANGIRQDLIESGYSLRVAPGKGRTGKTGRSRYNARLWVSECSLCGRRDHLETHHIVQQKLADKNGKLPSGGSKNDLSNLCVLCSECHTRTHNTGVALEHGAQPPPLIKGWCLTTRGRILATETLATSAT